MAAPAASNDGRTSAEPPSTMPTGITTSVPMHSASARSVDLRPPRADALRHQDVGGPTGAGDQGQHDSDHSDVATVTTQREQDDPAARQHHPQAVECSSRAADRDGERTGELDGDRDAEGQPIQRLVEAPVHDAEDRAVREHGEVIRSGAAADRGPCNEHQHHRGKGEPQEHHAARSRLREHPAGQRSAELHGGDAAEHEHLRGDGTHAPNPVRAG